MGKACTGGQHRAWPWLNNTLTAAEPLRLIVLPPLPPFPLFLPPPLPPTYLFRCMATALPSFTPWPLQIRFLLHPLHVLSTLPVSLPSTYLFRRMAMALPSSWNQSLMNIT